MLIVPRASTHLIYTDSPPILPASSNGSAMVSYYVQAWLGKYLKHSAAANYQLLSPTMRYIGPNQAGQWVGQTLDRNSNLSFYFCSGYEFNSPGRRNSPTPISSATGARRATACPLRRRRQQTQQRQRLAVFAGSIEQTAQGVAQVREGTARGLALLIIIFVVGRI